MSFNLGSLIEQPGIDNDVTAEVVMLDPVDVAIEMQETAGLIEHIARCETELNDGLETINYLESIIDAAKVDPAKATILADVHGAEAVFSHMGVTAMESEADVSVATEGLVDTIKTWLKKIADTITSMVGSVMDYVQKLINSSERLKSKLKALEDEVVGKAFDENKMKEIEVMTYSSADFKTLASSVESIASSLSKYDVTGTATEGSSEKAVESNKKLLASLKNTLAPLGLKVNEAGDGFATSEGGIQKVKKPLKDLGYKTADFKAMIAEARKITGLMEKLQGEMKASKDAAAKIKQVAGKNIANEEEAKKAKAVASAAMRGVSIKNKMLSKCASVMIDLVLSTITIVGAGKRAFKKEEKKD